MFEIIIILLLSYLLGSIPFALLVGKIGYGIDIREHGSGNLGGTNTFRTLGKKAGFIVSAADVLKGTLAASLPILLDVDLHPLIAGVPAVIGHCYPVFAKFKGGKAVATSGGVLLFAQPLLFVLVLFTFFLTLYISKYVSLSSIMAGVGSVILSFFIAGDWLTTYILIGFTLFLVYRHRQNIVRIAKKTEPKVKWI
ncbi:MULTISPECIES: glycerol-3-phosphate 1-O-acyltransferase PlsY [Fictibacillus]|uniref:glycerol-3-phosphate 1-O-acyltransferase PlsY n=1 Tax=Fictibacillus TaxID=1329200 RepID=UPI0018CE5C93|nr:MULTISPECIES: glycerol-3-phosphate 1-O-acyltransferase PlsY [unclassified Fictibacillus]MBH0156085.1 glycerol-3-phosphate 1-O-acyltransferase PlsY [Fictibacillus sp. 5RED26]MBH0165695.1 glycerol-3-phosphate 1-O-acyltransferase PlsY [Fictibacillus sp. 7GRE50]MBH0173256.1 glycerol-3-phosphate 1-O-acyltransferase PlsY [Fictibacillus sp. 23RED33]